MTESERCRGKFGAGSAEQVGGREHRVSGSGSPNLKNLHYSVTAMGNLRIISNREMGCSDLNFREEKT